MNNKKKKIVVAMSGGVDSSVAAKILKDQGHDVLGIFLHFWREEDPAYLPLIKGEDTKENKCCSIKAFQDARRVCQKINIPLYTLNFAETFRKEIVNNFIDEYKAGNTPNPCVRCNKLVKLGLLIKKARDLGYNHVASGHYARNAQRATRNKLKIHELRRAKDKNKDQSYFLHNLSQEQLSRLLFPLGDYTKEEVRKMAKKFKLPVAEKKESQEICFVPDKTHNEFLKRHLELRSGPIKALNGKIVGKHQGLPLYTIGQRKGIEIGGTGPFYAARMNYKTNTLYVVDNHNDPALFNDKLIAKNVNWISGRAPEFPFNCEAVIRYRHKPVKCEIKMKKNKEVFVNFSEPQRAITPGQSVVFYDGDKVLGGGIIKSC